MERLAAKLALSRKSYVSERVARPCFNELFLLWAIWCGVYSMFSFLRSILVVGYFSTVVLSEEGPGSHISFAIKSRRSRAHRLWRVLIVVHVFWK